MSEQDLKDQLEGLFSGLSDSSPAEQADNDDPARAAIRAQIWEESETPLETEQTGVKPANGRSSLPASGAEWRPTPPAHRPGPGVRWRLLIWSVLGTLALILLVAYGQSIFLASSETPAPEAGSGFVVPLTPTPPATPSATPTFELAPFTFLEPTAQPTPVSGGQTLVLTPNPADIGWVASEPGEDGSDRPHNYLGDPLLYAGELDGQVHYAILRFDLSQIPRGTQIKAASLQLTGRRADRLAGSGRGEWRLQLLAPELDYYWRDHTYDQIDNAGVLATLDPVLTAEQLGEGQVNQFEFKSGQLALLERRIYEGSDKFGKTVSFRLAGPAEGEDNLFGWDGRPAPEGNGPVLFLSLGPPPLATPPPYYVVITSTPTPENIMTAVANSQDMTAEATRVGTPTPLPPHWVTPQVVTATPTAENEATALIMQGEATAVAMTTGLPPNLEVVTVTPTPSYVIITSTPTPESIMTAVAQAFQVTAIAAQFGPATPFPENWVTPLVVTSTPSPENTATVAYQQAVVLTTGTPTPLPANAQTATPTPVSVAAQLLVSPTATATPSPTPQPVPDSLLGKIVFLSDREGATEEEREQAAQRQATPTVVPAAYAYDLATGQLERLTARWPYDVAVAREAWSPDERYETYTKQLLWTNIKTEQGTIPTEVFAIHYYDYEYDVEHIVTKMGAGIAYDAAWSPVDDEIVFVATETRNDEIWTIRPDGTETRQLTHNEWEWDKHPSWSPDGQQIVFFSNRTGNNQIWIMNKDGSDQRLLMASNPYNDWNPVWIKTLNPAPPLQRKPDWRFIKPAEAK